jgi:hypothetical protein
MRTAFHGTDLRGAAFRMTRFDKTILYGSRVGHAEAGGATGTIMAESNYLDIDGELQQLEPEQLAEWWHSIGATDVTVISPPPVNQEPTIDPRAGTPDSPGI